MKYKFFVFIFIIILISSGIIRYYYINKKTQDILTEKTYNIGDEVPFENDFFFNINEIANGYSITVLDTYYLTTDDFKEKYNIKDDSFLEFADYIYIIKANFYNNNNNNNEKSGISINHLILQESSFISYPDINAFMFLNEFNYTSFSLSPSQEREFLIPFGINEEFININQLINNETRLVVSLFPTKKMISLN